MSLVTQDKFNKVEADLDDIVKLLTDDIPNRQQVMELLTELTQVGMTFAGLNGLSTADRSKVVGAALLKIGGRMVESAVVIA